MLGKGIYQRFVRLQVVDFLLPFRSFLLTHFSQFRHYFNLNVILLYPFPFTPQHEINPVTSSTILSPIPSPHPITPIYHPCPYPGPRPCPYPYPTTALEGALSPLGTTKWNNEIQMAWKDLFDSIAAMISKHMGLDDAQEHADLLDILVR